MEAAEGLLEVVLGGLGCSGNKGVNTHSQKKWREHSGRGSPMGGWKQPKISWKECQKIGVLLGGTPMVEKELPGRGRGDGKFRHPLPK